MPLFIANARLDGSGDVQMPVYAWRDVVRELRRSARNIALITRVEMAIVGLQPARHVRVHCSADEIALIDDLAT